MRIDKALLIAEPMIKASWTKCCVQYGELTPWRQQGGSGTPLAYPPLLLHRP